MTDKIFQLSAKTLPLSDDWDVIVVGGGPAGCTAALAAAREGARTLLIEGTGCLGGMATNGLVTCWGPFMSGETMVFQGLAEKILSISKAGTPHMSSWGNDWVRLDPEYMKRAFDTLLLDAGVTVLFDSHLSAVQMLNDSVVEALLVANKAGLTAFRARVFVDATGDGDLAAWAGAPVELGDDSGNTQPISLCFTLSNVDEYARNYNPSVRGVSENSPTKAMIESGRYPAIKDLHMCDPLQNGPATYSFNAGHMWLKEPLNPLERSLAYAEGRRIATQFRDGLSEFRPQIFGNCFLANTASLLGIRESRRIIGDYQLTLDDYMQRQSFSDEIARNSYPIDIHPALDEVKDHSEGKLDVMLRFENYAPGESHGIPYRCLTPQNLHNVLVAGRCISSDRNLQGTLRTMPCSLVTGEAAGLAAAIASASSSNVHKVNTEKLRRQLQNYGAYLP